MPKISVIIPVYNTEKYLSECLDSVLKQTFTDIEVICVNDGSSDNSAKILEQYAARDKRIRIVMNQQNYGLSYTRNTGINLANGEYICFIDSDDIIDSNFLEVLLQQIQDYNADISMAHLKIFDENKVFESKQKNLVTNNLNKKIHNMPLGSVCDKLFKTKLIRENQIYFPVGRYFEDNIFLICALFYSDKIAITNTTCYYYRINNNGICRNINITEKKDIDALYIINELINFAKTNNFSSRSVYEIKMFIIRTLAQKYLHKQSKYFKQITQLLGPCIIMQIKLKSNLIKLKHFCFKIQNRKIKIFRIPIYTLSK